MDHSVSLFYRVVWSPWTSCWSHPGGQNKNTKCTRSYSQGGTSIMAIVRQTCPLSGIFLSSFNLVFYGYIAIFLIVFCSSPAALQAPVGRGLPPAQPPRLLGRWAAVSPARQPRPLWLLPSSQPSTLLETLLPRSPARSVSSIKPHIKIGFFSLKQQQNISL